MRTHIRGTIPSKTRKSSIIPEHRNGSGMGSTSDYSTLFRELFCIAAKDLADNIQEPLGKIGVLYGDIMKTGTLSQTARLKLQGRKLKRNRLDVAEKGQISAVLFGRGQLLFLVRQATATECSRLQAVGHRFATISNVVEHMARSMEVTREELYPQLERMRIASTGGNCLEPGIHFACFALRPRWHRGFDVLVPNNANYLLPTKFLTKAKLLPWQLDIVQHMDNFTLRECCGFLREGRSMLDEVENKFANELLEGITELYKSIDDPFLGEARLIARPIQTFCSHDSCSKQNTVFLLTFQIIVDAHQYSALNANFTFTPLKFFIVQQHAFSDSLDNVIFGRSILREFSAFAKPDGPSRESEHTTRRSRNVSCDTANISEVASSSTASPVVKKKRLSRKWYGGYDVRDDDSSEKNLVNFGAPKMLGDIHVANEVEVNVCEADETQRNPHFEMSDLGFRNEATGNDVERKTFADELYALTVAERRRLPGRRLP